MITKSMLSITPAIILALGVLLVPAELDAAPKSVHHICGADDAERIQDPRSQECIRKMEEDIKNGVSNVHYLLCLKDGGVSCCQDSGSSGARSCDRIFRAAAATGTDAGGDLTVNPGDPPRPKDHGAESLGGDLQVR